MKPHRLVSDLRNEREVAQKDLIRGLISLPVYSRFENGEKDLSYPMVAAFVQRLGKCCDKFELRLNQEEYDALFMQHLILHSLTDPDRFERLCDAFEEIDTAEESLHEQYMLMMRGSALFLQKADAAGGFRLLSEALQKTFPEWQEHDWEPYLLCTQELQILLLMVYCAIESKEQGQATWILDQLQKKITKELTDEEEYARIYPQFCYLKASCAIIDHDTASTRRFIRAGKDCVVQNGLLTLANEFLELEIQFGSDPVAATAQRDALHAAYDMAGQAKNEDVFFQMVKRNQHRELILVNELIRDTRRHQGIPQEELSWEICATETLSRIESGKRKPQKRSREKLFEKLHLDEVPYQVMETDDFHMLELDRDISRLLFKGEIKEARRQFYRIKDGIDLAFSENRQYIIQTETQMDIEEQSISCDASIPVLEDALRLTIKDYDGHVYRTPTRNEFHLLVQMAVYYSRMNQTEQSLEILLDLLRQYEASAVAEDDHAREYLTLYINLTAMLAKDGEFQRATDYAMKGIELALRCMRGDVLGHLFWNLANAHMKSGNKKKVKKLAKDSYHILRLYEHEKAAEKIKVLFGI